MPSNSLLDSLVGWQLYLPTVAVYALFGLLSLLAMMMVRPLLIDWLGVRSHQKCPAPDAHRPETLPQELA